MKRIITLTALLLGLLAALHADEKKPALWAVY
jgi:hypothetical protein